MAYTQSRTYIFQLMAFTLKFSCCCSSGVSWLKISIALLLSQCHSCDRKYLYFYSSFAFCYASKDPRAPSIFQETMSSIVPSRFFTDDGRVAAFFLSLRPHTVSVTVTLLVFSPYSCHASLPVSKNCSRVTQFLVLVDRLTVSALKLDCLAARTSMKLLTQSAGTMSSLLFLLPSMLCTSPVPIWQIRQVKLLNLVVYPQKLLRVGPSEGTLRIQMLSLILWQLFSTNQMLQRQRSTGEAKFYSRYVCASSRVVKSWVRWEPSISSSQGTQPGSWQQMLDRWTHLTTRMELSALAILEWVSRWQSTSLSALEKSTGRKRVRSTSMCVLPDQASLAASCSIGTQMMREDSIYRCCGVKQGSLMNLERRVASFGVSTAKMRGILSS